MGGVRNFEGFLGATWVDALWSSSVNDAAAV